MSAIAAATSNTATATSGSSSAAAASSTTTGLGNNFNTFLKLLTTQLQAQDPTSPLDTNQFTQQLVEFSQVEQEINTNTKLDSLIALQGTNSVISAQPLVGKTVELNDAKGTLKDGSAAYSYTVPTSTATTNLTITNDQGAVVWTGAGSATAGAHDFTWNGQNLKGTDQPSGAYTLSVAAKSADGSTLATTVASYGKVDGITSDNGTAKLTIGGSSFPMSELIGVKATS